MPSATSSVISKVTKKLEKVFDTAGVSKSIEMISKLTTPASIGTWSVIDVFETSSELLTSNVPKIVFCIFQHFYNCEKTLSYLSLLDTETAP